MSYLTLLINVVKYDNRYDLYHGQLTVYEGRKAMIEFNLLPEKIRYLILDLIWIRQIFVRGDNI